MRGKNKTLQNILTCRVTPSTVATDMDELDQIIEGLLNANAPEADKNHIRTFYKRCLTDAIVKVWANKAKTDASYLQRTLIKAGELDGK